MQNNKKVQKLWSTNLNSRPTMWQNYSVP